MKSPLRSPRLSEGIPPRFGPPSANVTTDARLRALVRPHETRRLARDARKETPRAHRVEAAVEALAVAAIAEKRREIFSQPPIELRARCDGGATART